MFVNNPTHLSWMAEPEKGGRRGEGRTTTELGKEKCKTKKIRLFLFSGHKWYLCVIFVVDFQKLEVIIYVASLAYIPELY